MFLRTYLHTFVQPCLDTCLYTVLCTRHHTCLHTCLHTSAHVSTHTSAQLSTHLPAHMSTHLSAHTSTPMSAHASIPGFKLPPNIEFEERRKLEALAVKGRVPFFLGGFANLGSFFFENRGPTFDLNASQRRGSPSSIRPSTSACDKK